MAHAIVRLDRMSATGDHSLIKSAKYFNTNTPADIDNGNIVILGDLLDNEREIYKATAPIDSSPLKSLGLVCSVEMIYDESVRHGLEDFYNKADDILRVFRFHEGDSFAVTAEAFYNNTVPEEGDNITFNGTKLTVASGTSKAVIGKVARIESSNLTTFYIIDVAL